MSARVIASNGYVLIKRRNHPRADVRGYVYEHIVEAEEMLGRALLRGEIVHHCNGVKADNRHENLDVLPSRFHHAALHRIRHPERRRPNEPNPLVKCACGCGANFPRFDRGGRPRRYVSGHNVTRNGLGQFEVRPEREGVMAYV